MAPHPSPCTPLTQVILYCQIGGSLEPWASSDFGRQSRSLTAAYDLLKAGYTDIQVGVGVRVGVHGEEVLGLTCCRRGAGASRWVGVGGRACRQRGGGASQAP